MSFKGSQCSISAMPEELEMEAHRKTNLYPAGTLSSSSSINCLEIHLKVVPV